MRRVIRMRLKADSLDRYREVHDKINPALEALYRGHGILQMSSFLLGRELLVYQELDPRVFPEREATLAADPLEAAWQEEMAALRDPSVEPEIFTEVYRMG